MLALEPEWSADKGWSATAQDAVQDAFIELSLGRGTVRHAAFRQALDTLPTQRSASPTTARRRSRAADRVPPLRVLHAELCEERAPIEELSLAQMRSLSAALVERLLRRRAAVRQAAKVSRQVDSALLRELLGVDEGARFVPVAAVIALLRDAAGAELPRARTEQLLALLGIERQPTSRRRRPDALGRALRRRRALGVRRCSGCSARGARRRRRRRPRRRARGGRRRRAPPPPRRPLWGDVRPEYAPVSPETQHRLTGEIGQQRLTFRRGR